MTLEGIEATPISITISGARTAEEAEWTFNAAHSWLERDEPSVGGGRYQHREGGWIVSLKRDQPLRITAAFRYAKQTDGEEE